MTFTFQEKGHKYELDGKPMTGVTTVLGVLAKPQLIPWAARMTAEWIRENCKEKDFEDFVVSESDLVEAVKAHTKKKEAGGEKGKDLHSLVEMYIKECIADFKGEAVVRTKDVEDKMFDAFVNWAVTNKVKFLSSETPTYSAAWFVAGTPDFTFEMRGKKYVGDLKSHKKIWDRVPHFQCAAYAKMLTENGQQFDGTCVVNVNKDTNELTESWTYDLEGDTRAFEAALTLYRQLNTF